MSAHPINLAFPFLLELLASVAVGFRGWNQSDSWIRFAWRIGLPMTLAAIWGIFAVPNDPSRSGSAPVAIPGIYRLILEFAAFTIATWVLHNSGLIG